MKKLKRKFYFGILSLLIITLTGSAIGVVLYSEWKLSKLVPGGLGERFPTKVYSAPFSIQNDFAISTEELIGRLKRLDYLQNRNNPPPKGSYFLAPSMVVISLRGFQSPFIDQRSMVVKLEQNLSGNWTVLDNNNQPVSQAYLEPELVAELSGPQKVRREAATWDDFPLQLVDAVISVEDRRFYKHHGVDLRAILRAAWFNFRHHKNLQGGSTITQQLAKNFFLNQDRTFQRKLFELGFAIYLDLRYSKEKILTLYMNHIYMGQDGVVSIAGMKAAAEHYFGKPLKELSLSECAFLAGVIRSPYRYNPFQFPDVARARRDRVLRLMLAEGAITEPEMVAALGSPLGIRKRIVTNSEKENDGDYFVAEVLRQLIPHFNEDVIFRYGLKIFTTVDPWRQSIAQRTITNQTKLQAALISLDPETGHVFSLVGGKNFKESQFNRATQAYRQPGSAFKPFVFGAALENGFTPASILQDEPRAFKNGKQIWAPKNFDGIFRGPISLRDALSHSINGATIDLAEKVGASTITNFAHKLGITSSLEPSLAIALGSSEVTPFELTAAYAAFFNGGFKLTPIIVMAVVDSEGNTLEISNSEREPVMNPLTSYLMLSLLQSTVKVGTAKGLLHMGWQADSAGKTGTTNEGKDAWFIGGTPHILTGIWVGYDEPKPAQLSGAKDALPIWAAYMKQIQRGRKTEIFEQPAGLTSVKIDPLSGLLARSGCPDQKTELFIKGTEPRDYCSIHAGGLKGWLLKIFQRKRPLPPAKSPEPYEDVD